MVAIAIDVCCVPKAVAATTLAVGPYPRRRIQIHAKRKSVLVSSSVGRRTGEIWDRRHSRAMFRATQGGLFPSVSRNREIEMLLNTNLAIFVCDAKISPLFFFAS